MKKIAYSWIILWGVTFSCQNNAPDPSGDGTEKEQAVTQVEFNQNVFDFENIKQGEIVSFTFKYKNVGAKDLFISNAVASCGCTVPKWDKEPIKPEDEGSLEVVFDSSGRSGKQQKTVTVYANTEQKVHYLKIFANIIIRSDN